MGLVKRHILGRYSILCMFALLIIICSSNNARADLKEVRQIGVLRHLGVPYAHFVRKTSEGYDGLDVEVMRLFAQHLGVKYKFISTTWTDLFTDLTGRELDVISKKYSPLLTQEIKGDAISNGLTVLPNRKLIVDYSIPTFPTGVWLIAPAGSPLSPIVPSGNIEDDVALVNSMLSGHSVLTMQNTCLDHNNFTFNPAIVDIKYFTTGKTIKDIVPAMLSGDADATLLDVPDALITLQEKSREIKVIGPVSGAQVMGAAFAKNSPELLKSYNEFFKVIWKDGTYRKIVEKYYPTVFLYYNDFFSTQY